MIRRQFKEPNFKCRVTDGNDPREKILLLHAVDRDDARNRINRRKLTLLEDPIPYDFGQWKNKAALKAAAVSNAVAANEKYDFAKNAIWGELKDCLFDQFDLKCAYCEITMLGAYWGDVDHYRPKNPVDGEPNHPGYYWLAYAPENYIPTCNKCNQPKSNQFPLAPGSLRAYTPEGIKDEQPLLLNPYKDDPAQHLTFQLTETDNRIGPWAKGLTDEGRETSNVLKLNRGDLLVERQQSQDQAIADFVLTRKLGIRPNPVVEQLKTGERPFSLAGLAAITSLSQVLPL